MFRYVIYAPLSLLVNLFVIGTSWFWAIFAAAFKLDRLPGWFALLHTHDENIYGLHQYGPLPDDRFVTRWWWATCWMCRNPAYGFDAYVLGVPIERVDHVVVAGEANDGRGCTIYLKDGSTRWGWRRDWHYGTSRRYCKMWFGWHNREQAGAHMLKFDINPFKRK